LVHRDDRIVLINPTGTEIGALGEVVRLGGGNGYLRWVGDFGIGRAPDGARQAVRATSSPRDRVT
jgi:hypothetical protein